MGSVHLTNIRKSFGAITVLDGINLSVNEGEFIALVGPSGCGKSTLLRLIAGLETVSGGTVQINSEDVTDLDPRHRDIAMVFQSYALYPDKDVRRNLGFGLKLRKAKKPEIEAKVAEASRILGLDDLLDRYPRELSGGQRQRVAMGRAIVRDPAVFLFDEPLSNLDAKLRTQMRIEIKSLHQRLKSTAIYVTHDQVEAMTMADRIVVMKAGEVQQIGSPLELYDRPQTRFVAEFIGSPSMNILKGRVSSNDGSPVLDVQSGYLPLPGNVVADRGQELLCGIRPDDLQISNSEGLLLNVSVSEMLGREALVYGDTPSASMDRAFCYAPGTRIANDGAGNMRLTARPDKLHLFDLGSERRLPEQAV